MTTHRDAKGRLHRDGGPAVENPDGSFVWYRYGQIHRLDGPAVRLVWPTGQVEEQYWTFGVEDEAARTITPLHAEYH